MFVVIPEKAFIWYQLIWWINFHIVLLSLLIINKRLCLLFSCRVVHFKMSKHVTNRWSVVVSVGNIPRSPFYEPSPIYGRKFVSAGPILQLHFRMSVWQGNVYFVFYIDVLEMCKYLLRKLMVLFAWEQMMPICLPSFRSDRWYIPGI